MWASVIDVGSHGMSKLQVCVDCMVFPSGIVMVNGEVAIFLFVTGAPSTVKCAVAPESDRAYCTAFQFLVGSNMVPALGSNFNCSWLTMWLQACCFGGTID